MRKELVVRELEGLLNRVTAFASLSGVPLDLEFAKEALRGLVHRWRESRHPGADPLPPEAAISTVAGFAGASRDAVCLPTDRPPCRRPTATEVTPVRVRAAAFTPES